MLKTSRLQIGLVMLYYPAIGTARGPRTHADVVQSAVKVSNSLLLRHI